MYLLIKDTKIQGLIVSQPKIHVLNLITMKQLEKCKLNIPLIHWPILKKKKKKVSVMNDTG